MSRTLLHFARHDDTSGLFSQLARRHDREKYRMRVATLEATEPSLRTGVTAAGIPCDAFGARSKSLRDYLRVVPRLTRYLRRNRVDILHTHFYYPALVGGMAGVLARTPLRVMTRHHADYHTRLSPGRNRHVRLDQLVTRLHHRVIAISKFTADHLIEVEGAPPGKIVVIPNGIDFETVRTSSPERVAQLRAEFGGPERAIILVAARLAEEKGVKFALEALPALKAATDRPFVVLSAGAGPLLGEYEALLAGQGTSDLVKFLGFRRDLPDLMAAADVLLVPSLSEAFGLVAAEALYLGTPVVATRVGGLPELVEDGRDGRLIPPGESAAIASTVAELLNAPEELAALRCAGRNKIIERFSFDAMLKGYEALYAAWGSGRS